jgi:DNA invertase Pin-like site-specific DNA recombinase
MGKLGLQITGSVAEFERGMIRQRVRAGLKTIKSYDRARRQVHVQSRRSA